MLSTTKSAFALRAISPVAVRSHSRIIGLVGVSAYTSFVAGVIAAWTSASSPPSTKVKVRPSRAQMCVIWRCVPP